MACFAHRQWQFTRDSESNEETYKVISEIDIQFACAIAIPITAVSVPIFDGGERRCPLNSYTLTLNSYSLTL